MIIKQIFRRLTVQAESLCKQKLICVIRLKFRFTQVSKIIQRNLREIRKQPFFYADCADDY